MPLTHSKRVACQSRQDYGPVRTKGIFECDDALVVRRLTRFGEQSCRIRGCRFLGVVF